MHVSTQYFRCWPQTQTYLDFLGHLVDQENLVDLLLLDLQADLVGLGLLEHHLALGHLVDQLNPVRFCTVMKRIA